MIEGRTRAEKIKALMLSGAVIGGKLVSLYSYDIKVKMFLIFRTTHYILDSLRLTK
jgi:hypothetical protein